MADILITGNDNISRIQQVAALMTMGWAAVEAPTFAEARAYLQHDPGIMTIVINVRAAVDQTHRLIDYIRSELGRADMRVIIIGANNDAERAALNHADEYVARPMALTSFLDLMLRTAA